MNRYAFAAIIREDQEEAFRQQLGKQWAEITAWLDHNGMHNFSLWNAERYVFGYYETEEPKALSPEEKCRAETLTDSFSPFVDWISRPDQEMRLMYHCFGIPREDKSLIRHRVFMTKLHPGCAEEYKKRHDALIAARNGVVVPGPDSNFSIWSDGNYIFGYNEIDTTMERPETPEEHQGTIDWETRQLGIMDWITNDCDWLTGEIHAQVKRLAWHN